RHGINVLTEFIEDNNTRVRANTVEALESLENKNLTRVFLRFRKSQNNRVRGNIIKALFTLGELDLFSDLLEMLSHKDSLMRATAVWVIGEIGGFDRNFLQLLEPVLNNSCELLLNNLFLVLKKVGDIPEIEFLRKKLNDHEYNELNVINMSKYGNNMRNKNNRWYDWHKKLGKLFDSLKSLHYKRKDKIIKDILIIIRKSDLSNRIFNRAFDFPLPGQDKRWYDNDPYLWLIINGLEYADKKLLKKITDYLENQVIEH
ncbi:MAG: HEAT repeat domain-containing protein, partial [bacterium]